MFKIWLRMLRKPLPRVLFGYVYGSLALSMLVFYFAPIEYFWKVAVMILFAAPYAIGIPLLELCLLARERRLIRVFQVFLRMLPVFILVNGTNFLLAPNIYWQTLFPMNVFFVLSGLFGSWGGRMIKLGYFGDTKQSLD
jgi:hypothetical protein